MFRLGGPERTGYLLGPTHEEEITNLVAGTISSYKDLPLRLYQISRKYRNELRPRGGLLRTREFLMKDLYTFDANIDDAMKTYNEVKAAYVAFFDELKVPYLVAEADSGAMGGNLSHEFHFATPAGEDNIWNCDSCSYVANEELVERRIDSNEINLTLQQSVSWLGVTQDKKSFVLVLVPSTDMHDGTAVDVTKLNANSLKRALPDIDLSMTTNTSRIFDIFSNDATSREQSDKTTLHILADSRISALRDGVEPLLTTITQAFTSRNLKADFNKLSLNLITTDPTTNKPLILNNPEPGNGCPRCPTGTLKVQRAVELGHTFHLGTRYSAPLKALVEVPTQGGSPTSTSTTKPAATNPPSNHRIPVSMGCHGLGISRLIGALASVLSTPTGLAWPRVLAPFEVVVVPANPKLASAAEELLDDLSSSAFGFEDKQTGPLDIVLDDRKDVQLGYKLNDADLIGYPVILVVGRGWKDGVVEVQCARLGVKEEVLRGEVKGRVRELLKQL